MAAPVRCAASNREKAATHDDPQRVSRSRPHDVRNCKTNCVVFPAVVGSRLRGHDVCCEVCAKRNPERRGRGEVADKSVKGSNGVLLSCGKCNCPEFLSRIFPNFSVPEFFCSLLIRCCGSGVTHQGKSVMKTVGVLAVSASASGFALAAIAKSKTPDESALRTTHKATATLRPADEDLDGDMDDANEEEE